MEIPMMLGLAGLLLLFSAYVAVLFGKVETSSRLFNLLNLTGALLLAYYTYEKRVFFFSVLLLAWAAVAVLNMIKRVVKK